MFSSQQLHPHFLYNQPLTLSPLQSSHTATHLASPSQNKQSKWTSSEDDILRKLVELLGENQWRKISEQIPGKNSAQCLYRWTTLSKPGQIRGQWTKEEDRKLVAWVKAHGAIHWSKAADLLNGRTGKQCRERWLNSLNPEIKKGGWTKEEDKLLIEMFEKYGSSWSKIAKFLPGRSENALKNRFYSNQRRITGANKRDKSEDLFIEPEQMQDKALELRAMPNALYSLMQEAEVDKVFRSVSTGLGSEKRRLCDPKSGENEAGLEESDKLFQEFLMSSNSDWKEIVDQEDSLEGLDMLQKKIFTSCSGSFDSLVANAHEKFKLFKEKNNNSSKEILIANPSQATIPGLNPLEKQHESLIKRPTVRVLTHLNQTQPNIRPNVLDNSKEFAQFKLFSIAQANMHHNQINPGLYNNIYLYNLMTANQNIPTNFIRQAETFRMAMTNSPFGTRPF